MLAHEENRARASAGNGTASAALQNEPAKRTGAGLKASATAKNKPLRPRGYETWEPCLFSVGATKRS
jgi:hypothetical protein